MSADEIIHHIALADAWDEAREQGRYGWSTLGTAIAQVGYLHASFPHQVAATLRRFYTGVDTPLVLLTLDREALRSAGLEVRVEPASPDDPRSERFPHVYGGDLPTSCVSHVEPLETPHPN